MSKNKANLRLPRSKGIDMGTYYEVKECARKVKRIVLPPVNRQIVEEFITILGMKDKFEQYDVPIPNKVVMFGPPGTGKTLTAFYLAARLELPLILVRLDAIIHSHLGETGSNIRKIFDYAKGSPCVLFLDEFDAVARTRENNDEVKEMARAVNTLLQCLDEFEGDSVFVAATNLEEELDHAVWRRFDTKMTYGMPEEASRNEFISLLIGAFESRGTVHRAASELLAGCSFADMEQIILKAKRKAIIEDSPLLQAHIETAFTEYKPRATGSREYANAGAP
ncbi:ATPase [Cohnella sp. CIP 111063]|uniref:AAA family ATPase n=1 Tax=unclassified Cohnella TaxID=2636738 RepID=UPI000B8C381D|nr:MULTISPECIES: ATP-binding protein [unclassified Cohnella]OXS54073.1 ATPase [Cohnella sp. CIP 111063]PRX62947.1 ATPase family protein associated with various cellular activities (AAA) [Cohnella sp. SGD-V74]